MFNAALCLLQSGTDMWLVFHDEGTSLHSLMYSAKPPPKPTPTPSGTSSKAARWGATPSNRRRQGPADLDCKVSVFGHRDEQEKPDCGQAVQGQAQQIQAEQGGAEEGWAEQSQAEQGKQGRAAQGREEESQTEQGQAGQNQAEQDVTEQDQAGQNQAEQGHTEQGINMPAADTAAHEGSSDSPQVPFNSTHCQ